MIGLTITIITVILQIMKFNLLCRSLTERGENYRKSQQVLVSRDIGISGGCVGPHDVTPDHPARARVAEGEDEGDDGGVLVIEQLARQGSRGRLPPRLYLHR